MNKTFNQEFEGYWRYVKRDSMPKASGIYCVYRGTYNSTKNTVNEDDDISTATIITTETTGTDDNVKTGDTFNLGIPVMLMMIALSGVVFIEGKRKRNKDQ